MRKKSIFFLSYSVAHRIHLVVRNELLRCYEQLHTSSQLRSCQVEANSWSWKSGNCSKNPTNYVTKKLNITKNIMKILFEFLIATHSLIYLLGLVGSVYLFLPAKQTLNFFAASSRWSSCKKKNDVIEFCDEKLSDVNCVNWNFVNGAWKLRKSHVIKSKKGTLEIATWSAINVRAYFVMIRNWIEFAACNFYHMVKVFFTVPKKTCDNQEEFLKA